METNEGPQLVIVALINGVWVIDQDSAYVLSEAAEGQSVAALSITNIEPLPYHER